MKKVQTSNLDCKARKSIWMKIIVFVMMISLVSTILISNANAAWWNDSFEYRKPINITSHSNTDLINFTVFLNISKESVMQDDYDDLRFTNTSCGDTNVGLLEYEIEHNFSTHGIIWVEFDTLQTAGAQICMYYGNSSVVDIADPNSVWEPNYGLVHHMDPLGNDSTSNNRDRVSDLGSPSVNNTFLGLGMSFDGTSDAWSWQDITYLEQQWSERTHEIVFRTSSDMTSRQTLFAEGGSVNGNALYIVNGLLYTRWWSESQGWVGDHLSYDINASTVYHVSTEYSNVGGTYTYRLYVNGRDVNSSTTADFINAHTGNGGMGYTGGNTKDFHDLANSAGHYYEGSIYEMRVYDDNKTAGWVNMTAQNLVVDHAGTVSYGSVQENRFGIVVDEPPTASIFTIRGNRSFEYNITATCLLGSSDSCGNISLVTQYNASPIANISTSPGTDPIWINESITLQPQSCILTGGASCSLTWNINMSGNVGEVVKIRTRGMSNVSSISLNFTQNLSVEIAAGNAVTFNQTTVNIPSFTKNTGNMTNNASVISTIGNNTGINVTCNSGNCSSITDNWIDGTNLNEGISQNLTFTCDDRISGSYWALFGVVSSEDTSPSNINVSCVVLPVFGPINITLDAPNSSIITNVSHDQHFDINTTINCNGTCGNISAYVVTDDPFGDGSDGVLNVGISGIVVNNYTQLTGNEVSGSTVLNVGDSSEFSAGDEILIIQIQNASGTGDSGNYEFAIVNTTGAGTITVSTGITNTYGSGTFDTTRATASQVIRVPHYSNVTITSGSIVSPLWNGSIGGIVVFRVNQTINTSGGPINVSSSGYRGGDCNSCGDGAWGDQGESIYGLGISSNYSNFTGGGGGYGPSGFGGEPGAGGGHATIGGNGTGSFTMIGGESIGMSNLSKIFFGGGAGGGGDNDNLAPFAQYVDGGGIAIVYAKTFVNATIYAHGQKGGISQNNGGTTGAGAGGTIWVVSENISVTNISADGEDTVAGFGSDNGGSGGDGRVRLDYVIGGSITSSPTANFTGSISDIYTLVSTTSGTKPMWINGSTNPQSCIIAEDGSCSFSWLINASGDVNTTLNFSVIAVSNYSVISGVVSDKATVKIVNMIPQIYAVSPENMSTIIYDPDGINITWFINDTDDFTLRCNIFVNMTNVFNQTCINGNNSAIVNMSIGMNNWSVRVYDNINSTNTTGLMNVTLIQDYWARVDKQIGGIADDMYIVNISMHNYLNYSSSTVLIEFVEDELVGGSFTPNYDFINVTHVLPYLGTQYGWDLTLVPNSTTVFNYSLGSGGDYNIKDSFMIGLG